MDDNTYNTSDKESSEKRNANSEWLPTKCRITKPPPPKPATNPLQFVKVTPCALFQKAHEQIKKVEEIKTQRCAVKEEAEEWQQNLDNWKSSRRKRQEHIIERVVEVKKLEQEGYEKNRRKSKTFNEMLEDRSKRKHRLNIPIYDDSNDLSDYGIGSSSSKTNSVKDIDTDDSSSCLDDKDLCVSALDSQSGKNVSSASNQSYSEDELLNSTNHNVNSEETNSKSTIYKETDNSSNTVYSNSQRQNSSKPLFEINIQYEQYKDGDFTYQRAIEDYRSKILPKLNENDTVFTVKFDRNSAHPVPKVEMYTTKPISERNKPIEITGLDLNTSKRLSEDFSNSLSIKERLKNLEKCADLQVKSVERHTQSNSVKSIIESFTKQGNNDKNDNFVDCDLHNKLVKIGNINNSVSVFLVDKPACTVNEVFPENLSPNPNAYFKEFDMFGQNLVSYLTKSHSTRSSLSECCENTTAPFSTSSSELTCLSSDRTDSGIHTADVSCSVSQADESADFNDILASTIPNCIEKLQKERERELTQQVESKFNYSLRDNSLNVKADVTDYIPNYKVLKQSTQTFLDNIRQCISNENDFEATSPFSLANRSKIAKISNYSCQQVPLLSNFELQYTVKPVIYENVEIKKCAFLDDAFSTSTFPLAPPKTKEPPKEKPPPPPLSEEDKKSNLASITRLNSTKRIKKELHIKRSSFLGLHEPMDEAIDSIVPIDTLPDINICLQKESQLEKSLYRKYHDSHEVCSSEVESQDSGLENEMRNFSSDTCCNNLGECNMSTHHRQDSETNNSVTSEDEIAKKEREIIALVEKEEESKNSNYKAAGFAYYNMASNNSKDEKLKVTCVTENMSNYSLLEPDQDAEVLIVKHELLQLEKEELKRKKENVIYKENKEKLLCNNRYSLENICDIADTFSGYYEEGSYRKSMPELPNAIHSASFRNLQSMKPNASHYYKPSSGSDIYYRKSMPNIQAFSQSVDINDIHNEVRSPLEHRKSMPELQKTLMSTCSYSSFNKQIVMPSKPLTSLIKEKRDRNKLLLSNSCYESDLAPYQNMKPVASITRPGLNALSAVPKYRNIPNDNWIQPKINGDNKPKTYNKHWLYQEAELCRLAEKKTNNPKWNYQQPIPEQHIPDPIIQTLTQRFQNLSTNKQNHHKRSEANTNQEIKQTSYLSRSHMLGHASPICYPPLTTVENLKGNVLSVSGKKKCSFCGNELGRGAAMIIESLCLCYHIDCFKCCVCHIQLGNGLMGTDVRVRNQKLHCHNCYTSDDGVKFSCV